MLYEDEEGVGLTLGEYWARIGWSQAVGFTLNDDITHISKATIMIPHSCKCRFGDTPITWGAGMLGSPPYSTSAFEF